MNPTVQRWLTRAGEAVGRIDWRGLPWPEIALGTGALVFALVGWQRVAPPLASLQVEAAAIVRQEAPSPDASRVRFVFETATGQIVARACGTSWSPCDIGTFRDASRLPGRALEVWHDSLRVYQVKQGDRTLMAYGDLSHHRWLAQLAAALSLGGLAWRLWRRHRGSGGFQPTQQSTVD